MMGTSEKTYHHSVKKKKKRSLSGFRNSTTYNDSDYDV